MKKRPLNRRRVKINSRAGQLANRSFNNRDFRMHFSLPYTAATDRGHPHTISLKLRDINQLFNSMDPSPFIEKDLDDDAEEFIVSWAQEFSPKAPVKLRIYLDQWPAEDPKELIRTAIHNHFAHCAKITDLEFKRLLRQGRTSLFIGLLFLAACGGSARNSPAVGRSSMWVFTHSTHAAT